MELALIRKFIWKNKHARLAKGTLRGSTVSGGGPDPADSQRSAGSLVAGAGLQRLGGGGPGWGGTQAEEVPQCPTAAVIFQIKPCWDKHIIIWKKIK